MSLKTLCSVLVLVMALATSVVGEHYYGGGEEIPLAIDSNLVTILFHEEISGQSQQTILDGFARIGSVVVDDHSIGNYIVCSLSTGAGYMAFVDSLQGVNGVSLVEPYYRNEYDSAMLAGARFCVSFDTTLSSAQIDSIIAANKLVIDREITGMAKVFVLKNTDSSGYTTLEIANLLYQLDATNYSHPEFSDYPQTSSYDLYDYYHSYQPHTKKVIGTFNQASVWDFAGLSRSVVVAVVDDGVDSHEDLPASRVLSGYDYADNDSDPAPGNYQAHGMGCAGIIGASHSTDAQSGQQASSGVISLYPGVDILPVKIFTDSGAGIGSGSLAQAITYAWQNGADILSNSWGYRYPTTQYDVLDDALERASLFGRDGRGCPVIFAAGNGATSYPGQVSYPASLPFVLAVGATQLDDYRWYYIVSMVRLWIL